MSSEPGRIGGGGTGGLTDDPEDEPETTDSGGYQPPSNYSSDDGYVGDEYDWDGDESADEPDNEPADNDSALLLEQLTHHPAEALGDVDETLLIVGVAALVVAVVER